MKLKKYLVKSVIILIKFYHNHISSLMLYRCRFYPSCSIYTIEAIEDRGLLKGCFKALWRIVRCNPCVPGGYEPYKKEEI